MSNSSSRVGSIPIPRIITSPLDSMLAIETSRASPSRSPQRTRVSPIPFRSSISPSISAAYAASRVSNNNGSYEPRIVRAGTSALCSPTAIRPSQASLRPSSSSRSVSGSQRAPPTSAAPTPFSRPSYLRHSVLHDLLRTDAEPTQRQSVAPLPGRRRTRPMSPSDSEDDGSPSPPPRDWIPAVPPPPPVSADSRVIRLPSQWSSSARYPTLSLSPDCRELSSDADKESPAARTDHPAPPACGVYYFEVRVSSKSSKSHISIGFASKDAKLSRLPGWDSHSWGYYGEDGCTLYGDRNGRTYADGFGNGDIIGCCIDFTSRKAFFTKNGRFLGPAFDNIPVNVDLYPSVGFRQNNESVRVNLGQEPFKFNIEEHVQERKSVVWQRIMSTPLSGNISSSEEDKDDIKETMYELVMEYLAHHGYSGTAKALRNQHADEVTLVSKAGIDVEMADAARRDAFKDVDAEIELRTSIVGMVAAGRIEEAMSATREHFPGALEIEDGLLLLKLRCRRFVELILDASDLQKRIDSPHRQAVPSRVDVDDDDLGMDMDIDDDAPVYASNGHTSSVGRDGIAARLDGPLTSASGRVQETPLHVDGHEKALSDALAYGRALWTDYKHASEERRTIVERAFCVVAFSDPREAGGLPAEVSSIETRIALSAELNQAILKCQGKPTRPALEMMYQHTAACVQQLGVLGVGEAAFADMYGEIIADDSYNTTNLLQPKPDFLGQSSEFGLRLV